MNSSITDDIGPEMNGGAIKVYDNEGLEDFPILKAFQQYVEAEQTRARKRLVGICIIFSSLLLLTIAVFVVLLVISTSRNQALNDRLVEFAMNGRMSQSSAAQPSTVQQPDASAVLTLSKKLEDIRSELADSRAHSEKSAAEAPVAKHEKSKTSDSLEIERLKALLSLEKEKAALEREKKRQLEIEEYRRKHYPELYENKKRKQAEQDLEKKADEADREIESILKENKTVSYFDDEDEEDKMPPSSAKVSKGQEPKKTTATQKAPPPVVEKNVTPPKNLRDEAGNTWEIPLE